MTGNHRAAELLLQKDPNLIDLQDVQGRTAADFAYPLLVNALSDGREDLARLLIVKGAPLDSEDESGELVSVIAMKKRQYDIARLILQKQEAQAQQASPESRQL
ncbi:hypothetical protein BU23DRAFT_601273 [Bimuria novae-zelandiae CBS 107.79]|uniref:Uncharacterized protein n=1 Tax=Bimuria novae-zelandiae CBS 107.79 TaxID=1447943 RepID=A0A6A5V4A5_9PLEO|nr:hypothetical protein BU23DRAFT_601273 [Bimuria novae-zelandiae CBS 107.79]